MTTTPSTSSYFPSGLAHGPGQELIDGQPTGKGDVHGTQLSTGAAGRNHAAGVAACLTCQHTPAGSTMWISRPHGKSVGGLSLHAGELGRQVLGLQLGPVGVEVLHLDRDHLVLLPLRHVDALEHEIGPAPAQAGEAVVLPRLGEAELGEESQRQLEVRPRRHEGIEPGCLGSHARPVLLLACALTCAGPHSCSFCRLYRKSQWLAPCMMVCVRVSFMSGPNPSAMGKSALQTSRKPRSGSPSSL